MHGDFYRDCADGVHPEGIAHRAGGGCHIHVAFIKCHEWVHTESAACGQGKDNNTTAWVIVGSCMKAEHCAQHELKQEHGGRLDS
jgi:hypothetical protein